MKRIKFQDIKTPTTVEEFRANLRKFVCSAGKNTVYVQEVGRGVAIDDISSFDDIKNAVQDKKGLFQERASIVLKLDWSMDDVTSFMNRTGQITSCNGYWQNKDSKYAIYDFDPDVNALPQLMKMGAQPQWVSLDNKIFRELFVKMFGVFSGYTQKEQQMAA